jgi:hypothetical protein
MSTKIYSMIDFNENYYEILGLTPEDIPSGKDLNSKKLASTILREAYHKKLFEVHPDRPNGDEQKCKLVVKAHMILSDNVLRDVYDRGNIEEYMLSEGNGMKINWNKLGRYRKGSLADMIGSSLFKKIMEESGIENIKTKFVPEDELIHNYHWEFTINGLTKELVLSIVEDEAEVLKLTDGNTENINNSLPFKIYICFPSIKLVMIRDEDTFVETTNGNLDIIKGKMQKTQFIDADILGTTNYENAIDFITSGKLKKAVDECKNGNFDEFLKKFKQKQDNVEINKIMEQQDVKKIDQSLLQELWDKTKFKKQ